MLSIDYDIKLIVISDDETILLNENDSLSDYKVNDGSEIRISRQKEEWRPKMTKYETQPSWEVISKMTRKEIEKVEGFTVENQHGKVTFIGETDLTGMDIDRLIEIEKQSVEVYP